MGTWISFGLELFMINPIEGKGTRVLEPEKVERNCTPHPSCNFTTSYLHVRRSKLWVVYNACYMRFICPPTWFAWSRDRICARVMFCHRILIEFSNEDSRKIENARGEVYSSSIPAQFRGPVDGGEPDYDVELAPSRFNYTVYVRSRIRYGAPI